MNKLILENNLGEKENFFLNELNVNIKIKNKLRKLLQDNCGSLYFLYNNEKVLVGIDINLNLFTHDEKFQYLLKNNGDNKLTILRENNKTNYKLNLEKTHDYINNLITGRMYDNNHNNTLLGIAISLNVKAFNSYIIREQCFPTNNAFNYELYKLYNSTYINDIKIKDILYTGLNSLKNNNFNFLYLDYVSISDRKNNNNELLNIKCKRVIKDKDIIEEFVVNKKEFRVMKKILNYNNPLYKNNRIIITGICKLIKNNNFYYKEIEQFVLLNVTNEGLYINNNSENLIYELMKLKELIFTRNIKRLDECNYSPFGILLNRINGKVVYLDGIYNSNIENYKENIFNGKLKETHICLNINNVNDYIN